MLRAENESEEFDDLDDAIRAGLTKPVKAFDVVDSNNQVVWQWSE
jgi:hypothetical protein